MRGDLQQQPETLGFLVHEPSQVVGLLLRSQLAGVEQTNTIELAGGDQMTAPANEFRAASLLEIEEFHRAAALVHPFTVAPVEVTTFIHTR